MTCTKEMELLRTALQWTRRGITAMTCKRCKTEGCPAMTGLNALAPEWQWRFLPDIACSLRGILRLMAVDDDE